jgi:hypothetical protein
MTDALTDLDKAVIEALGAYYARGGEAAFDEAVPPISSTKRFEIVSPSPEPPYLRVVAAHQWKNRCTQKCLDA